ncbi:ABC transporter permease [Enemella evansiae]|uniref:ABC transporter permease n=1 Tax=Enemella evansiae TaxID=2016499 RepID=A0A255GLV5_9ACTN|nr:ABC transporter permease [Enemella evansiae]OYO16817.1 ABC transporter permease [Enemella evansiae]OYO19611.1 ABC transporter permease [Enemella evansiae]
MRTPGHQDRRREQDVTDSHHTTLRTVASQRRGGGPVLRVFAPVLLGLVVLSIWQLLTAGGRILPTLLPSPAAVFTRFADDLAAGQLLTLTGTTLVEALLGSLLAAVIALPLGYLIAHWRVFDAAVSPYLAASQAIPAVAVAPLLVIWVGYGLLPIMLLCALLVFFPVVLSTVLGIRGIRRELIEAAELDGAAGVRMLRHIEWPLALRAVLTGIRNGFTLSITGAVVGELVMGGNGLGMLLSVQASTVDTTGLFATLLMLCLLAVAIYLLLVAIEWASDPLRDPRRPRTTARPKETA